METSNLLGQSQTFCYGVSNMNVLWLSMTIYN